MIIFGSIVGICITLSLSYAWFKKQIETGTKVTLSVGNLTYQILQEDVENNRIIIPANDDIKITIKVKSNQEIVTNYGVFYNFETALTDEEKQKVKVYNYIESVKKAEDSILENGENTIELIITNTLHQEITITLGITGGLINNSLEITGGNRITGTIDETDKLKVKKIVKKSEDYYKNSGLTTGATLNLPENNSTILYPENDISGTVYIKSDGRVSFQGLNDTQCLIKRFDYTNVESVENHHDVCSKPIYKNLIINGYGEYGDDTNFSKFIYNSSDNDFKADTSDYVTSSLDFDIKIDRNKKYHHQIDMYSENTESINYAGFIELDIDKSFINSRTVMYEENTLTTLAQDLNDGDTVIYFTDLSNWVLAEEEYRRGLIFWNYQDSTGYMYPELSYSKNVYTDLYTNANINKSNHTITLNSPWANGKIEKGTKLSQSNEGASYNYGLLRAVTLQNSYQTYANTIDGIGSNNESDKKFRPATEYIRANFMLNYQHLKPETSKYTYLKNVIFEEVD